MLILREVLAFPTEEVAVMLDTTTAAIKSILQRARARLDDVAAADRAEAPSEPARRRLLEQYIAAFERSDPAALERVLRTDAAIELVGTSTWFAGRQTCLRFLSTHALGEPGDWRMTPTAANGQPAVAAYFRDGDGVHRAWGIAVLDVSASGIARIVVFSDARARRPLRPATDPHGQRTAALTASSQPTVRGVAAALSSRRGPRSVAPAGHR